MKKLLLITGALLLSNTLPAVNISPNGKGEFLLIPYYNITNDYNATVNIFNHDDKGKAVKIHVRESHNGFSVLSYNVYLAPEDSWTFALGPHTSTTATKPIGWHNQASGKQVSFDQSCAPDLNKMGHEFTGEAFNIPSEPTRDFSRTLEGFIEIIEMATIEPDSDLHHKLIAGSNGNPVDCQSVTDMWQANGVWTESSTNQLLPPSGTLSAEATLINSPEGIQFPIEALAFANFFEDDVIFHTAPNSNEPTLNNGMNKAVLVNNGQIRNLEFEKSEDAVSALLMKDTIAFQYVTETNIAGATETGITFPTRRFYINYSIQSPPFDHGLTNSNCYAKRGSNTYYLSTFDRNGIYNYPGTGVLGAPIPQPPRPKTCGTTATIRVSLPNQSPIKIFHSNNSETISTVLRPDATESGVHHLRFDTKPIHAIDLDSGYSVKIKGIPVIGTNFQKATNANAAPGLLAQYGYATPLKTQTEIQITDVD